MNRAKLCTLLLAAAPLAAWAQMETYTLDPYHTIPHFSLEYHGFGTITGRFDRSSGKFSIDRSAGKAALEFSIEAASINTGDGDRGKRPRSRDEHLRTVDFFNVAEFPRVSFKSTNVRFNGAAPAEIDGEITLLGVTRPLSFKVERWVCKDHVVYKRPTCGGNATATLKRSDFGMKYGIPSVGDEIRLSTLFLGFRD
jgi:polyisoprenoid-binding protein YceI